VVVSIIDEVVSSGERHALIMILKTKVFKLSLADLRQDRRVWLR
jgi:hypothetical protein